MSHSTDNLKKKNISVYYDGLCHLCSREIGHYKKMAGSENIEFIDITNPSFDPAAEGLDPFKIHQSLHVRDKTGNTFTGVEAFFKIWNELPSIKFLVPIASWFPIHTLLNFFYIGFTKLRPLLPRKSCDKSPFCSIHSKP